MRLKWTVSTRLIAGFGVLCLFLLGIGVFSLNTMHGVNLQTQMITENWMPSVSNAYRIKLGVTEFRTLEGEIIKNPRDDSIEKSMLALNEELKKNVDEYVQKSKSSEGKQLAKNFGMDFAAYQKTHNDLVNLAKSGETSGAQLLYDDTTARFFAGINQSLDKLIAISEQEASRAAEQNQSDYARGNRIIVMAMVLVLLFSILLSYWTSRSIIRPIRKINEILRDLAEAKGDLQRRVILQTGDEIQAVADNVNNVLDTIEKMVVKIRASAVDFTQSTCKIKDNCIQLSCATEEITNAIADISDKAIVQSEKTETTRQMIETYAQNLDRMTEYAKQTFQLANLANSKIKNGNMQIAAILEQMQNIGEQNQVTNETLNHLQKSLEKIEEINKVIKKISEKTNILALNAGIEAARAGTFGKGFAVVANEVRKLSNDTKESSQHIVNLLAEIQTGVQQVNAQSSVNTNNIMKGREQIELMLATFDEIHHDNQTVMDNGEKTKEAAEKMMSTVNEVVEVFASINVLTGEQSGASQQVSASAEEQLGNTHVILGLASDLANKADQLNKLVEQFRVGG
ncbi:MAG TPA: methyl-accepting chemotaxis protein [Bacilli bacterium]